MKKVRIKNKEVTQLLDSEVVSFPKYATQLINLANQNAQGTRPEVVGQMSDLSELPPSLLGGSSLVESGNSVAGSEV